MTTARIYIASAGSGKTFTLVNAYLKILFFQASNGHFNVYRNILAITFTNKATHEMKTRIVRELKLIARKEKSEQLNLLKTELPHIKQFDLLADKILIQLLHDYSNFNVQTIDSFFQQIIRSFAKELELPINFEIILDKEDALQFAVDELIDQIGKDKTITNWLRSFAFSKIDEDKSWNFRENVLQLSREVFNADFNIKDKGFTIDELKKIKQKLQIEVAEFEKKAASLAESALEVLNSIQYPEKGFSRNYLPKWLTAITDAVSYNSLMPNATLTAMLKGEKPHYTKAFIKDNAADIASLEASSFFEIVDQLFVYIEEGIGKYIAHTEIFRNIYSLGVLHKLNDFIKTYRAEQNALFLSDATKLINEFISLDNTPFLFEKLASKIQYLFIDEFQDTATIQWHNLMPICQNILGVSEYNIHLLMVGDAKQSIYRWRNGDYELLTHKAKKSLEPFTVDETVLDTNYRSLPAVVDFNNAFFQNTIAISEFSDDILLAEEMKKIYNSVHQEKKFQAPKGKLAVQVLQKTEEETWQQRALQQLLIDIRALQQIGYGLHDMAILVRKKKHGIEISRFLQEHEIEILSEETLLLQHNDAIKLLVAGLTYINHKSEPLHYTNFLWQVYKQEASANITKHTILSDYKERKLLSQYLPKFEASTVHKLDVYEALELLINQLDIDDVANLFVAHFKQLIFNFMMKESGNIDDFLNYWEKESYKLSIQLKNGNDKINVLTVHKSKGLEFPVVLMPYCDWNFHEKSSDTFLWVKDATLHEDMTFPIRTIKQMQESQFADAYLLERRKAWIDSINLLYVAFTRAKEVLHISTGFKKPSKEGLPLSAAQLIIAAVEKQDFTISETDDSVFEIGSLANLPLQNKKEESDQLENLMSSSATPLDFGLQENYTDEATNVGNLVHKALYYLADNNLQIAFNKALAEKLYTSQEQQLAKTHFEAVVKNENTFMDWVSNAKNAWDEQPIFYEDNLYRPDKIFQLEEKYVIVDFKTGADDKKYHKKIATYMNALKSMDITKGVEGYILFTESGELIQINPT